MQIVTLQVEHPCAIGRPIASSEGARAIHLFHRGDAATVELRTEATASLDRVLGAYARSGAEVVERDEKRPSAIVRFPRCACCRTGGVVAAIEAAGHQFLPPVRYTADGEQYPFLVLRGRLDRSVFGRLRRGVRVTGVRARPLTPFGLEGRFLVPAGTVVDGITEKQRRALLAAIAEGYFQTPRRIGSDRLAGRFGISRPAFDKLLRRGEERLLDSLTPYLVAIPPSESGGRPRKTADRRRGRARRHVT